jgi:PPOX class probable F420-dependent enzyme
VLTTLLPDGSPHSTEVWVDADGDQVLVNSVDTHRKVRNVRRDPRVALVVLDPDDGSRHVALRGRVAEVTTEGARDHIEKLALRYLGGPYPWFGGRDQTRVLLRIDVDWLGGQLR